MDSAERDQIGVIKEVLNGLTAKLSIFSVFGGVVGEGQGQFIVLGVVKSDKVLRPVLGAQGQRLF